MSDIRPMSACSLQEISGVSYDQNAKDTMTQFCKKVYGTGNRTFLKGRVLLYTFYVFSAAVPKDDPAKPLHGRRAYGEELAAFILENKMGHITVTPHFPNEKFHPDHSNKVWVWAPDFEGVKVWWNKELEAPLGPPPAAFKIPEADYGAGLAAQLDYGADDDVMEEDLDDDYDDDFGGEGWDDEDVDEDF